MARVSQRVNGQRRDDFGSLLRTLRYTAGLTQEDLADRSGLSVRAVRNLERGVTQHPHQSTVGLLVAALRVDALTAERLRDVARRHVGDASLAFAPWASPGRPGAIGTVPNGPTEPARAGPVGYPSVHSWNRDPVPRDLPLAVGHLVGRSAELGSLDDLVAPDSEGCARLVLLVGSAGVGKTALAVRWAHRARHRFPDGQLYVELGGPDDRATPRRALRWCLRRLGVPSSRVPVDVGEAASAYRSLVADRRMLVVIDGADDPRQVRPLLPGGAECAVLVTSRERLSGLVAREGARRLTLDVLSATDSLTVLERILGARVRAEPVAAAALVDLCGRLPSALSTAAEQLADDPALRLANYVQRLRWTAPLTPPTGS